MLQLFLILSFSASSPIFGNPFLIKNRDNTLFINDSRKSWLCPGNGNKATYFECLKPCSMLGKTYQVTHPNIKYFHKMYH